ncbi:MAG: ribosomal-processing cysteine protease Prp [Thermaerobacter sp.]|nr:ribosomal-processing cysteine protease Prp [Bacillota bacterium]REJ37642.1 MAG: ribosomal-processing cysteine protease Prp [Bacillota bacterium]
MIEAVFVRGAAGNIVEFSLSGHAGFAERGRDVVCAAVSALAQAALIGLEEVLRIDVEAEVDDDQGRLRCRIPEEAAASRLQGAAVLTETLLRSLRSIEAGYPGHVQVREINR